MTVAGIYKFFTAQDFSAQMSALENEIQENEILLEQKKAEFYKSENSQSTEISENEKTQILDNEKSESEKISQDENKNGSDEDIAEKVKRMPIVAFGDSIMLGASNSLYDFFPNIYIDAKVSRMAWSILEPVEELSLQKKLGEPIVIHLGSNGYS